MSLAFPECRTVGHITLMFLALCLLLTVYEHSLSVPFSSLCHPASLELLFNTMPGPTARKSQSSRNPQGIDYVQCSKCTYTCDYANRNWCHAHISRANVGNAESLKYNKRWTTTCAGAKVMYHHFKQTMKTAIGGTAHFVEDTQAPPHIPASPAKTVTDPYIPIQEYQHDDQDTDIAMLDGMEDEMVGDGTDPEDTSSTTQTQWQPTDLQNCLLAMRSGSHLMRNPGDANLTDLVRRLLHDGSMASTFSAADACKWTDADIHAAQQISHLLSVNCFTADADQRLVDLHNKLKITHSQQMILSFCLEHNLSQTTSSDLMTLLQDPRMNLKDLQGKTYKTLHNNIKDNIPEEYAFKRVELHVGNLYGVRVPVTDQNGNIITVPVRSMINAMLLLYADRRYENEMVLVPEQIFQEGPDGKPERVFCGFKTCESYLQALNGPPVIPIHRGSCNCLL